MTVQKAGSAVYIYLLSVLVFSIMDTSAKYLSGQIPLPQILAMRALFGFIPVLLLLVLEQRKQNNFTLKSNRFWWQVARGISVALIVATFFAALSLLPFADVVGITLIAPLFMMISGVVFLGESFRLTNFFWCVLGLLGVLLIIRPGGEMHSIIGVFLAIISALLYALSATLTRALSAYDSSAITSLYSSVILSLLVLTWLAFEPWQPMSDLQLSIGVLLGMAGGLGNILLVVAFSLGSVSRLGVLDYTAYIWALVFGYLLFAEQPHSWALVGTCLVVYAGYRVTFDRQ